MHHIAVISKVCILHVVCFSVPYYFHDKQLYFPIHNKLAGLHTRSPEYILQCTIGFCVQLRLNSCLRVETSFLKCLGYRWPGGKKVAEE